jgi:hypothetical protein
MPEQLVGSHTRGGQWVEVGDAVTFHNNRRVIAVTIGRGVSLELDVTDDAVLIERIAEALLKVLGDVKRAAKDLERVAAKAAINAEVAA